MPRQLAPIGQPVSVCHQWSMTGTLQLLLGPGDGRRIGALAGEEQGAEPREIVARGSARRRGPRA